MRQYIPFRIVELEPNSYHILVDATINNTPVVLIVDSGASRTVIDKTHGSHITPDEDNRSTAVGFMSDNVDVESIIIPTLQLGNITITDIPAAMADLSAIRQLYVKVTSIDVGGLLGCDFLIQHVSSINMTTQKIFLKSSKLSHR